jgi:hypothetical protein
MGFLDRLLGRGRDRQPPPSMPAYLPDAQDDDARAVERYRYLLRTAPPEQIEQAHAEAFAALTPSQRQQVLQALSEDIPPGERSAADDPRSLARMATRAEMRQPGTLERRFRSGGPGMGMGPGLGMGGVIGGSLLGSVAGAFIGSAIAQELFGPEPGAEGEADAAGADDESRYGNEEGADQGYGEDQGGDFGGGDFGGGDFGGDF